VSFETFGIVKDKIVTFNNTKKVSKGEIIFKGDNLASLKSRAGKGTVVDEKQLALISEKDGYVRVIGDKFFIDSLEIIDGNFDFKHGTKKFFSSLWIKGDVYSGSRLIVDGNLQIDGTVENCIIKCNGSIIILGNLYGQEKANIIVRGNAYVKSITGAKFISYGDILVGELIRHSTLFTASSLEIKNKGEIIGGKIYAKDKINAKILGSENIIKTSVSIGYNFKLKFFLEQMKNNLKNILLTLKKNREFLERKFNITLINDNDYIDFVMKNLDKEDLQKNMLLEAIESIKLLEKARLIKKKIKNFPQHNLANLKSFLRCNTIYPGVTIRILDKRLDIINKISGDIIINRENIDSWQQL